MFFIFNLLVPFFRPPVFSVVPFFYIPIFRRYYNVPCNGFKANLQMEKNNFQDGKEFNQKQDF